MDLPKDIPNPIEYLKDVRNELQANQQKQLFFEEQFQKMVENGNEKKAVELIHDEANNLNARLNKEVTPEDLARYCLKRCMELVDEVENSENFQNAIDELKDQYDVSLEEQLEAASNN